MKMMSEPKNMTTVEIKDDFNWGATIAVLILLLAFIGASFYVLVISFMDI